MKALSATIPPATPTPWPNRYALGEEELTAVRELFEESMRTGISIGYSGSREKRYTEAFSAYMGGGFADAVNSGSNGIYVALRALDIEPFSEVIVPCITDPGGVMPVPLNNLIPVPADTCSSNFNMGPEQVLERITPRTRAVLVAHIAGIPADMTGIMKVAKAHNLRVIEDCSQSHGAVHQGRMVGSYGDVGVFSTMFSKHHCMGGQGGVVFSRDENLIWELRRCSDRGKNFNISAPGNVKANLNCNADEIGCAIGLVQLSKLPSILERRRETVAKLIEACRDIEVARVVEPLPGDISSHWFVLMRFEASKADASKEEFIDFLTNDGIPFYPTYGGKALEMPWYENRAIFGKSGLPWSSPSYKGDPNAVYKTPNGDRVIANHFMLYFNEQVGEAEVERIAEKLQAAQDKFGK